MRKVRWHFILFWVALFFFWYTWPTEGYAQDNFDHKLIVKLGEMMKVETPKTIRVERLSQKGMLSEYRDFVMADCMRVKGSQWFQYCFEASRIALKGSFVHGLWVQKKEQSDFHIRVYERSGIDVVVHEFLHWYLHYSTEPNGVVNNHSVLTPMVNAILTSEEFVNWLDKEGG